MNEGFLRINIGETTQETVTADNVVVVWYVSDNTLKCCNVKFGRFPNTASAVTIDATNPQTNQVSESNMWIVPIAVGQALQKAPEVAQLQLLACMQCRAVVCPLKPCC